MNNNNLLLIGAGGDIGSAALKILSEQGWDVTATTRRHSIFPTNALLTHLLKAAPNHLLMLSLLQL